MKEHIDSLRCLRNNSSHFFTRGRSSHPPQVGGRGRGYFRGQSRYQPFPPKSGKENFQRKYTASNQLSGTEPRHTNDGPRSGTKKSAYRTRTQEDPTQYKRLKHLFGGRGSKPA